MEKVLIRSLQRRQAKPKVKKACQKERSKATANATVKEDSSLKSKAAVRQ